METKLILSILSWVGLGSYVAGILLNLGTWKSDLLAVFGFAFILLKFIRLTIKTYFDAKKEDVELKILKKKAKHIE